MGQGDLASGVFSLLRWRLDATRDEARNVAVVFFDEADSFAAVRAAPLSSISSRLHEQGILDDILQGLEQRVSDGTIGRQDVAKLQLALDRSLVLTELKPVAVGDPEETLAALYRAYVAPRARGGSRGKTKGVVLDRAVDALRKQGVKARRGAYIDDFIFDIVLDRGKKPTAVEVLSFAVPRKDWAPVERDAAHFLYGISKLGVDGWAVVEPPANGNGAGESHDRIRKWLDDEDVAVFELKDITKPQQALDLAR